MKPRSASSASSITRSVSRCTPRSTSTGRPPHPLYRFLKAARPGLLGSEAIKWNFTKFLVGRDGAVLRRYAPADKPEDLAADISAALGARA